LLFLQLFLLIVSSVAWAVCGRVNELQILTNRLEDIVASRVVSQRDILRRREDRITVLAHDLQVPLIGIRNLVQLLLQPKRQDADGEKSRKLLNVIGEASEQALALADRLLSNDEIKHLEPAPEPVDWVELLRSVSRRASLLEVSRELRFAMQCDEPAIEGSVDRTVILQILENLCHNAVKVSPHAGSITLGLHQEGKTVVITVADQGPGFPSQEIPTLFNKVGFRQRIRTLPESTGLGLFIVGKSVRDLGGTITCKSVEGQGATFTIRLPRHAI
jgi:signal transduction histidine kinase